jgi:photosystem II stability/assembly factor-like uncharacterized protein
MKISLNLIQCLLVSILLTTTIFSQQGWVQQSGGIPCNLSSVYFANEDSGWTVSGSCPGGGLLMKTTDGGSHWTVNYNIPLFSIQFIDGNTGWTVGGDPYGGRIKKSTDGGITWVTQVNLEDYGFSSVSFIDENIGYACGVYFYFGSRGVVFKTTNGGNYWFNTIPYPYTFEGILRSVFFVNQNLGWTVGDNGVIRKTTNGGNDWDVEMISDTDLYSVFFVDENNGWIVGNLNWPNLTLHTTNGGSNWYFITQDSVSLDYLYDVYFIDINNGWIVGENGNIFNTTDAGASWIVQNSGTVLDLHSVDFIDHYTGWVVGSDGTILKTTNSGVTFIEEKEINSAPTDFSLKQNYPNPFNPTTKIRYNIPSVGTHRDASLQVTLKFYDVLGNEVAILVNEEKPAGTYEVEFNKASHSGEGRNLPSGIYFYQLRAGDFRETKKMILLK